MRVRVRNRRAAVILSGAALFVYCKRDLDRRRLEDMKAQGPRFTLRDVSERKKKEALDKATAAAAAANSAGALLTTPTSHASRRPATRCGNRSSSLPRRSPVHGSVA